MEGESFYGQPVKSFQDIQKYAGVSPKEPKVKTQSLPKEDQATLYQMVVLKQLIDENNRLKDDLENKPAVSASDLFNAMEKSEQRGQIEALAEMFSESERRRAEEKQRELLQKRRSDMQKKLDPLASLAYFQAASKAAGEQFKAGQPVN